MQAPIRAAIAFAIFSAASALGQAPPDDANLPPPGSRGNADNVPFIGKRDPSGNPVRLAKASGHVSNYAEDKVPAYSLPDPLVMASGERVTTVEMWRTRRRPEILKLYQTEIYGRIPDNAPRVTWTVA